MFNNIYLSCKAKRPARWGAPAEEIEIPQVDWEEAGAKPFDRELLLDYCANVPHGRLRTKDLLPLAEEAFAGLTPPCRFALEASLRGLSIRAIALLLSAKPSRAASLRSRAIEEIRESAPAAKILLAVNRFREIYGCEFASSAAGYLCTVCGARDGESDHEICPAKPAPPPHARLLDVVTAGQLAAMDLTLAAAMLPGELRQALAKIDVTHVHQAYRRLEKGRLRSVLEFLRATGGRRGRHPYTALCEHLAGLGLIGPHRLGELTRR